MRRYLSSVKKWAKVFAKAVVSLCFAATLLGVGFISTHSLIPEMALPIILLALAVGFLTGGRCEDITNMDTRIPCVTFIVSICSYAAFQKTTPMSVENGISGICMSLVLGITTILGIYFNRKIKPMFWISAISIMLFWQTSTLLYAVAPLWILGIDGIIAATLGIFFGIQINNFKPKSIRFRTNRTITVIAACIAVFASNWIIGSRSGNSDVVMSLITTASSLSAGLLTYFSTRRKNNAH